MGRSRWIALPIVIAIMFLCACSSSGREAQENAFKAAEKEFQSGQKKPDRHNKHIEYYLPFGFEKDKETPNNILLKNGSKKYILFYNSHEKSESKVVYESSFQQLKKWDLNKTFEKDGKFGYMLSKEQEDGVYQVVVGIGGVKVTTETTSPESDAPIMMDIAHSASIK